MKVSYKCDQCGRLTAEDDPFKVREHRTNEGWRSQGGKDYCSEACMIKEHSDKISTALQYAVDKAIAARNQFADKPFEVGSLWGASWTELGSNLEDIERTVKATLTLLRGTTPTGDERPTVP